MDLSFVYSFRNQAKRVEVLRSPLVPSWEACSQLWFWVWGRELENQPTIHFSLGSLCLGNCSPNAHKLKASFQPQAVVGTWWGEVRSRGLVQHEFLFFHPLCFSAPLDEWIYFIMLDKGVCGFVLPGGVALLTSKAVGPQTRTDAKRSLFFFFLIWFCKMLCHCASHGIVAGLGQVFLSGWTHGVIAALPFTFSWEKICVLSVSLIHSTLLTDYTKSPSWQWVPECPQAPTWQCNHKLQHLRYSKETWCPSLCLSNY